MKTVGSFLAALAAAMLLAAGSVVSAEQFLLGQTPTAKVPKAWSGDTGDVVGFRYVTEDKGPVGGYCLLLLRTGEAEEEFVAVPVGSLVSREIGGTSTLSVYCNKDGASGRVRLIRGG